METTSFVHFIHFIILNWPINEDMPGHYIRAELRGWPVKPAGEGTDEIWLWGLEVQMCAAGVLPSEAHLAILPPRLILKMEILQHFITSQCHPEGDCLHCSLGLGGPMWYSGIKAGKIARDGSKDNYPFFELNCPSAAKNLGLYGVPVAYHDTRLNSRCPYQASSGHHLLQWLVGKTLHCPELSHSHC